MPHDDQARSPAGGRAFLLGLVLAMTALASCSRMFGRTNERAATLASVQRWWILIGHAEALELVDWRHAARDAQMVVLSGDPRIPLGSLPNHTVRLGYMSVGEADAHRGYWFAVRDRSYLVEPNPDWPENMRVDVRDKHWQNLLLSEEAPRLMGLGFQGFMLDTVDTAGYLERKDPAKYAGSRQAMRAFARALREKYPNAVVIANGGEGLVDVAPFVDGLVIEGLYATYDFGRRAYRATTDQERTWKLAHIARAQKEAALPVFSIEYADLGDIELGRWAAAESARQGFHPYVTVKDLNAVP